MKVLTPFILVFSLVVFSLIASPSIPVSASQQDQRFYGVLHGFLDECQWHTTSGPSMEPTIHAAGDAVCVARFNFALVTYGDLVYYRTAGLCRMLEGDKEVLHRVVGIGRATDGARTLWTKGDANQTRDLCDVTEQDYIGMVTVVWRR